MDTIKAFLEADANRNALLQPTMRPNLVARDWDIKEQERRVGVFGDFLKLAQQVAPAIRTMLADIGMAREQLKEAIDLRVRLFRHGDGEGDTDDLSDAKIVEMDTYARKWSKVLSALDKYKGGV